MDYKIACLIGSVLITAVGQLYKPKEGVFEMKVNDNFLKELPLQFMTIGIYALFTVAYWYVDNYMVADTFYASNNHPVSFNF